MELEDILGKRLDEPPIRAPKWKPGISSEKVSVQYIVAD
jgi:hypothetical protein